MAAARLSKLQGTVCIAMHKNLFYGYLCWLIRLYDALHLFINIPHAFRKSILCIAAYRFVIHVFNFIAAGINNTYASDQRPGVDTQNSMPGCITHCMSSSRVRVFEAGQKTIRKIGVCVNLLNVIKLFKFFQHFHHAFGFFIIEFSSIGRTISYF